MKKRNLETKKKILDIPNFKETWSLRNRRNFLKFPIFRKLYVRENAKISRNSQFLGVPDLSELVYVYFLDMSQKSHNKIFINGVPIIFNQT